MNNLILVFLNSIVELGLLITIFTKQESPINATDLVGVATQAIHVLAFFTLLYKTTKFIYNNIIYKKVEGSIPKLHTFPSCNRCIVIALVIFFILYAPIIIATPILYTTIIRFEDEHSNQTSKAVLYSFVGAIYVTHLSNAIIRLVMITATLIIKAAWLSAEKEIESDLTDIKDTSMKKYEQNGQFVTAIQGVFEPWFVLQWITYFVEIFQQNIAVITYIENKRETIYIVEAITSLTYTISAFAIPYGCGIIMNKYHDSYHRKLKEKLRELSFQDHTDNESIRKKKDILALIINDPRYQFKPYICGLSIPLNNVGHMLTILLSLLAPVLSLVKFRE